MVPQISTNYIFNLIWTTLVIPNLLRFIIGNVPRLAVDRVFFLTSTLIALIIVYLVNLISRETRDAMADYKESKNKKLKLNALLVGAFTAGALITYGTGIDTSIYSNMGWETGV
jgi:FlaA1/EpsC-like NDP-sugar epimerase